MKELKKIIQKYNTEIMELKFGCEIIFKQKEIEHPATILYKNSAGNYLVNVFDQTTTINKRIILKILGRPITIADVLIALGEYNAEAGNKIISFRNYYPHSLQFEEGGRLLAVWNLKKNLDGQKEKTIKALKKILLNK